MFQHAPESHINPTQTHANIDTPYVPLFQQTQRFAFGVMSQQTEWLGVPQHWQCGWEAAGKSQVHRRGADIITVMIQYRIQFVMITRMDGEGGRMITLRVCTNHTRRLTGERRQDTNDFNSKTKGDPHILLTFTPVIGLF